MNPPRSAMTRKLGPLVANVQSGDCVLVLGPRIGAPDEVALAAGLSVAEDLSRKLLEDLGQAPEGRGLLRAIAQYERARGSTQACRSAMQQLVAEYGGHTTPLHMDLARLPFKLVLNATFDGLMAEAFRQAGKTGVVEAHYDFHPAAPPPPLKLASLDRPIVYSLFGSAAHPESMVLNEQNLLDYLVAVTREQPPLPDAVRATLRAPSTVFLFIGFGFDNWWLRLLLQVLQITGVENRPMSLGLEDPTAFDEATLAESKGFFGAAGIDIVPGPWNEVVQALTQSVKVVPPAAAPSAGGGGPVAEAPAGAPMVFLSYASEDRDTIERLRAGLLQRGLAVWQDKNNLRVGENWENQIEQVIKRVAFFVFVQTPAMDARDRRRDEGVYNLELKLALERQKRMPENSVFVVHVTVGECGPRPEKALGELHRIAVDDEAGLDRLATDLLAALGSEQPA